MRNYILTRQPDQYGQPDWTLKPEEPVTHVVGIQPLVDWDWGWITEQVLSMKVGESKIIQANI